MFGGGTLRDFAKPLQLTDLFEIDREPLDSINCARAAATLIVAGTSEDFAYAHYRTLKNKTCVGDGVDRTKIVKLILAWNDLHDLDITSIQDIANSFRVPLPEVESLLQGKDHNWLNLYLLSDVLRCSVAELEPEYYTEASQGVFICESDDKTLDDIVDNTQFIVPKKPKQNIQTKNDRTVNRIEQWATLIDKQSLIKNYNSRRIALGYEPIQLLDPDNEIFGTRKIPKFFD